MFREDSDILELSRKLILLDGGLGCSSNPKHGDSWSDFAHVLVVHVDGSDGPKGFKKVDKQSNSL